ncbi:MAG: aspartate--tRNA(Asn) ligase [Pseudomonadota bacterium]
MERTLINELNCHLNQEVKIQGWIQNIRAQKNMVFVILRDHTGLAQVVLERALNSELADKVCNTAKESAVTIQGLAIKNEIVKLMGLEVQLREIEVNGPSDNQLPFDLFGPSDCYPDLDVRMDWRFLDLRKPENLLIFKMQTSAEWAMREYWNRENFIEIHSPKFIGTASESGAELFAVEYFGKMAYLAQSPQFYKQMAMSAGFNKVFEIGPVFRANPSFTSRHDTEFTSVDVEMSWIQSHEDVMSFEERWLQYIFKVIKEKHEQELLERYKVPVEVPEVPFPRIKMAEAMEILKSQGYTNIGPKSDLDPEGERLICKYTKEKYNSDFVFVIDYPKEVRPFYHMRYDRDPEITKSFDLLWKGLELTTGAQREHRYEILKNQVLEKKLKTEPLQFYLDFFKYGCPPHGGYGFGLTRMLMILLNLKNVREVTYLYRGPNRLSP